MPIKSHAHERYGTLRKASFCTRGYVEIHTRRPFFDNKKANEKIENPNSMRML
jgi:hypothetical protein